MIGRLEETGKWTFSFIGATLDAVEVATQMDIKVQNSFSFTKEGMKDEVWDKLSRGIRTYANKRQNGENLDEFYK